MTYKEWMQKVNLEFYREHGVEWELLLGDFCTRDYFEDGVSIQDTVDDMAEQAGLNSLVPPFYIG